MSAVIDIDFAPAENLAGVVAVGVFAGDADEFIEQRAHIARRQIVAVIILTGCRFDLGRIL